MTSPWMRGRVVEGSAVLTRRTSDCPAGSNPAASANWYMVGRKHAQSGLAPSSGQYPIEHRLSFLLGYFDARRTR
jgi:hypothetical protein